MILPDHLVVVLLLFLQGEIIRGSDSVCSKEENWDVCLSGGVEEHEGNVFVNGKPVCDDNWDQRDADVVCRQLAEKFNTTWGQLGAAEVTTRSRFGSAGSVFEMDDVDCSGREERILDCRHNKRDDCGSAEAAGVICDTSTPEEIAENEKNIRE